MILIIQYVFHYLLLLNYSLLFNCFLYRIYQRRLCNGRNTIQVFTTASIFGGAPPNIRIHERKRAGSTDAKLWPWIYFIRHDRNRATNANQASCVFPFCSLEFGGSHTVSILHQPVTERRHSVINMAQIHNLDATVPLGFLV